MPGRRYTAAGAAEPDNDRDRARAGGFVGRLGLEPRTRGLKVRCAAIAPAARDRSKRWETTSRRLFGWTFGRAYPARFAGQVSQAAGIR